MTGEIESTDIQTDFHKEKQQIDDPDKLRINWYMTFLIVSLHIGATIGTYLLFTGGITKTVIFGIFYALSGGVGITAGNHRLWCHRSYKAKFPLRVLFCILSAIGHQKSILIWCKEHRIHHKYAETNADPYNIKRGFFFAHMGWIMCRHHPEYIAKINSVSLSDLLADPIIRFESKYHLTLKMIFSVFLPIAIPMWFWNESLVNAVFLAVFSRICIGHHFTFVINSVAHTYGNKPYCKEITARNNRLMAFMAMGEGWHNYHHVFPWDYSLSEWGYNLNFGKVFIDMMGKLGLAYDMKTASPDAIQSRKLKCDMNGNCQTGM